MLRVFPSDVEQLKMWQLENSDTFQFFFVCKEKKEELEACFCKLSSYAYMKIKMIPFLSV